MSEALEGTPRKPLFRKYFVALFAAVVVPLLINGFVDAWLGYRDQRALLDTRLRLEATSAATRIEAFLQNIRDQLEWMVHLPWSEENADAHRLDALRLLRQLPAIVEVALLDDAGTERLRVSRIDRDVMGGGTDRSAESAFVGIREARVWHGPVTLNQGSEPYMTLAVTGNRAAAGVAVAEVNLKLIWNVIAGIRIGEAGGAFVVDGADRLVAHPEINRVLRGADGATAAHIAKLKAEMRANDGQPVSTRDMNGRAVLVAMTPIAGVDWVVFAEQPLSEAYAPIRAALWRTLGLIVAGMGFAFALAYLLARRMVGPIMLLKQGAAQIGAGNFSHRIAIRTGDELERLATQFNEMASELALSKERSERIARLKRFLSPQVAEIVDSTDGPSLLEPRRAEVAVVFCDLRGYTSFSDGADPEEILQVIGDYYAAVGACITQHSATLTQLSGDGVMILVNAPVPSPDESALRAVRLTMDMQAAVQRLIVGWRARGHSIGFGIGIAKGQASVGRVGYEGRHDYTAVGSVVNLASRLCAAAEDGQILLESTAAAAVSGRVKLTRLGARNLKGLSEPVQVFALPAHGGG